MPLTPYHMGPGLLLKAILQGSFSLMVFGWTQIVIDIQPLIALLNRDENIHGFTHTYVGATLIAMICTLSGKYLAEYGLVVLHLSTPWRRINISWPVSLGSAFIGAYSHVLLDGFMHKDMHPWYPFSDNNNLLYAVSVGDIYKFCTFTGLLGSILYFVVLFFLKKKH